MTEMDSSAAAASPQARSLAPVEGQRERPFLVSVLMAYLQIVSRVLEKGTRARHHRSRPDHPHRVTNNSTRFATRRPPTLMFLASHLKRRRGEEAAKRGERLLPPLVLRLLRPLGGGVAPPRGLVQDVPDPGEG